MAYWLKWWHYLRKLALEPVLKQTLIHCNELGFDRMQDGHMKLAPRAAEQHKFDPDDRLVVISGSKFKNS